MAYSTVPKNASLSLSTFRIDIPEIKLTEMRSLLEASKIAQPTFESTQADGQYGITSEWITAAKREWQTTFDW